MNYQTETPLPCERLDACLLAGEFHRKRRVNRGDPDVETSMCAGLRRHSFVMLPIRRSALPGLISPA